MSKSRPKVFSLSNPPQAPRKRLRAFSDERIWRLPGRFREMQYRLLRSYVDDEPPMAWDDWLTFVNGMDMRHGLWYIQPHVVHHETSKEVVEEWAERYNPMSQPRTQSEHNYCLMMQQACERQLELLNRPSTPPSPTF